jgi:biotin operon repressor
MEKKQSNEPRLSQGELHPVLRLAAAAYGLPDAVLVTGHALLRYIPQDAEQAISPARVQDLADERGCDPRTIRSHIRRLEAYGLAIDRSAGGGRRMIQRRRGRIVVLHGIDFSPMLAAAEAIGLAALRAEAEVDERRQLAARVSELKRQLRHRRTGERQRCGARRRRRLPTATSSALQPRTRGLGRQARGGDRPVGGSRRGSRRSDLFVRPDRRNRPTLHHRER